MKSSRLIANISELSHVTVSECMRTMFLAQLSVGFPWTHIGNMEKVADDRKWTRTRRERGSTSRMTEVVDSDE